MLGRKKLAIPRAGYQRKDPYVKMDDPSRRRFVLGVCVECGVGKTFGSDFCRNCLEKKELKNVESKI